MTCRGPCQPQSTIVCFWGSVICVHLCANPFVESQQSQKHMEKTWWWGGRKGQWLENDFPSISPVMQRFVYDAKGFWAFQGCSSFTYPRRAQDCRVQFFIEKGEIQRVMSSTCPYVAVEWCAAHKKFIYHRNMAGVGRNLKDHLIPICLPWAWMPPARSSCPEPHPTKLQKPVSRIEKVNASDI